MRVTQVLLAVGLPVLAAEDSVHKQGDAWEVEGVVSDHPHAHPIRPSAGEEIFYVDTVADGQLVAYASEPPPPRGAWARFRGTVFAWEAGSKKPGSTKTFLVHQLRVEEVERLPKRDEVAARIEKLGRDDVPLEKKNDIQNEIYAYGMDAFPVLIANLDDGRVYAEGRDVQNYVGMAPDQKRPDPLDANVTVGSVCRALLHRMLIPAGYRSPKHRVFKPRAHQMFVVESWEAWWRNHRHQTLEQIHEELKPLVDRYYESGGDPQTAP